MMIAMVSLIGYWVLALLGSMVFIIAITFAFRKAATMRPAKASPGPAREEPSSDDAEMAAVAAALAYSVEQKPIIVSTRGYAWTRSAVSPWKEAAKLALTASREA